MKLVLTFGSRRNKSQAEHICTWPIASINPAELRALPVLLCTSQGTRAPLAPAPAPARGQQDTAPRWGTKLWKIPLRSATAIFEMSAITAGGDGPPLQSGGRCLVSQHWDKNLCKWDGALNPRTSPPAPRPDTSRQNQNVPDILQQHLSSPHSSHFGKRRG